MSGSWGGPALVRTAAVALAATLAAACSGDDDTGRAPVVTTAAPATTAVVTEPPASTTPRTTTASTASTASTVDPSSAAPATVSTTATALDADTCTELRRTVLAGDSGDALVGEAEDLRVLYREAIARLALVPVEAPAEVDGAVATMVGALEEFVGLLDRFDGDLDALAAAAATDPALLDQLQIATPTYDAVTTTVRAYLDGGACPR